MKVKILQALEALSICRGKEQKHVLLSHSHWNETSVRFSRYNRYTGVLRLQVFLKAGCFFFPESWQNIGFAYFITIRIIKQEGWEIKKKKLEKEILR